jgi:hypothetical protein
MTEDKLTIRLTDDQQKQIQEATGKKVTALNIAGYGSSRLTDQDLDKIIGGSGLFEIEDYSFDIEQTLSIGSQSSGAGAGKVK